MSDWDFERQHSETRDTLKHLSESQDVSVGPKTMVTLDVFLAPGEAADQEALERALAMFGYTGEMYEDEETKELSFTVSIEDVALTADDVWLHEERVSKIAIARGYTPDGWGFFEP